MNRIAIRLNELLWLAVAAIACLTSLPALSARAQSGSAAEQAPAGPTYLLTAC